ncbi:hypothetical protein ACHWQZ_G001631 [Mnemiopsis leidyi]
MSCQTGIVASSKLANYLASNGHHSDRCIKITIEDEELQLIQNRISAGDYESDWDRNVMVCVEDDEPCYIFYRLDQKANDGAYNYVFMSYVPNDAGVKNKMLYAATRATLKRIFGDNRIATEFNCTVKEELSLQAYKNHVLSHGSAAPMTEAEKELAQVKKDEAAMRSQMSNNSATLPGLNLPATQDLLTNLEKFRKGFINYLQIKLDTETEELKLWDCANIKASELSEKVPVEEPRYHLFNFNHEFEGNKMWSVVFIYSCPGYSVPVKQRMMYSSTKACFLDSLAKMDIEIAAKQEISEGDEVKENDIYEMIHPQKHASRAHFVKPKAPSRGGRRLIR